eukprot:251996_1
MADEKKSNGGLFWRRMGNTCPEKIEHAECDESFWENFGKKFSWKTAITVSVIVGGTIVAVKLLGFKAGVAAGSTVTAGFLGNLAATSFMAGMNPAVAVVIGGSLVAMALVPPIITAAGFTAGGVAASSWAAWFQSMIGNVVAGSWFAFWQAVGDCGAGATIYAFAAGVGGAAAVAMKFLATVLL